MHLMRHVVSEHLIGKQVGRESQSKVIFSEYDEKQNRALYALKTLMQRLNKEHSPILRQKLLSVELIRDRHIHELPSLDYFSQTTKEPMKLLFKATNSWLLNDLCRDLFSLLEDFDVVFGECYNKLRLMLDFTSICFKMSFIFVSDASFPERLRKEVLIKAGERAALKIMEVESFEPPFSLQDKS